MTQTRSIQHWKLGIASVLVIGGALACSGDCTFAQPIPDGTLPNNSLVTPQGNTSLIEGGTQVGTNLFHSFKEFSVPFRNTAHFDNALTIENIISRVTGGSISNIEGAITANGTANLFLLNPNGIIFGPNARIGIRGSFLASTASSLLFADGTQFSATAPQATPLLTVSVPIGLQFGETTGAIQVQKSRLAVQPGKTLVLVGGEIALEGGSLGASEGRIELGSVGDNSLVGLTQIAKGWALSYEGVQNFQDIQLTQQASLVASGGDIQVQGRRVTLTSGSQIRNTPDEGAQSGGNITVNASESVKLIGTATIRIPFIGPVSRPSGFFTETSADGDGGNITIHTRRLLIQDGAVIIAGPRFIDQGGSGGNVIVNAPESLELEGSGSLLSTATFNSRDAGSIIIETGQLIVRDGAEVLASTKGQGRGGDILVNAADSVILSGVSQEGGFSSGLLTNPEEGASGQGGKISVTTDTLRISDGAVLSALRRSNVRGGEIEVNVNTLEITGGGQILTTAFSQGDAGKITINANDKVILTGSDPTFSERLAQFGSEIVDPVSSNSGLFANTTPNSKGTGGDIVINTQQLTLKNEAQAVVSSTGTGTAGSIQVNAKNVLLNNQARLAAETQSSSGGNITLDGLDTLEVNNSKISASTETGRAGNIDINARESVLLRGKDGLSVEATGAGGIAGDLTLTLGQLTIEDGATINVSSLQGQAGNVDITVNSLSMNQGTITATTAVTPPGQEGANINIQVADTLTMQNESQIEANALEDVNGGNVNINTEFLIVYPPEGREGSDITANAERGNGGRVNITARGIFGTAFRPRESLFNDITASSEFGTAGTVALNTPNADPSRGLDAPSANFVDPSQQIAQSCSPRERQRASRFVATGRGGLPLSPDEPLESRAVVKNWVELPEDNRSGRVEEPRSRGTNLSHPQPALEIVEAQGWTVDAKGNVALVAQLPVATAAINPRSQSSPLSCY